MKEELNFTMDGCFLDNCTLCNNSNLSFCLLDYDNDTEYFEYLVRIIVPVIFGLIVFLGFVGNILVIIVVWCNKQMQNTTNILIVSLAIADLFFIIFCVPFTAVAYALPKWLFGSVWCKIVNYMIYVCANASVWTLVLMSFDRYLAVVHPVSSMRIRNRKNTYIMIILTWTIFSVGHIRLLLQYDVHVYTHGFENRSVCMNMEGDTLKYFHACFFAFGYVIPLSLICVLYGFLLKRLLYGIVPGGSQRAESIRSKKRVTRMIIVVVVVFALCWLPIQVFFLVDYLYLKGSVVTITRAGILIAANCIAYMNSCVNPFLYAFLSENFRRSFKNLLCCKKEQWHKFECERTQVRGTEKEHTKENLLNNATLTTDRNGKDSNCNSEAPVEMKLINAV